MPARPPVLPLPALGFLPLLEFRPILPRDLLQLPVEPSDLVVVLGPLELDDHASRHLRRYVLWYKGHASPPPCGGCVAADPASRILLPGIFDSREELLGVEHSGKGVHVAHHEVVGRLV